MFEPKRFKKRILQNVVGDTKWNLNLLSLQLPVLLFSTVCRKPKAYYNPISSLLSSNEALLDSSLWFTDVPLKKAKSSHPTQTQLDGRRTGQCHSTVYHLTYFTILSPLALLNTVWRVTFSRRMRKACNCKHPLAHTHRKISKYTHSSKVIAGNSQYEWWAFVFADTRQQRLWHGCMREINTRKALCYIWIGMHMHTCRQIISFNYWN